MYKVKKAFQKDNKIFYKGMQVKSVHGLPLHFFEEIKEDKVETNTTDAPKRKTRKKAKQD